MGQADRNRGIKKKSKETKPEPHAGDKKKRVMTKKEIVKYREVLERAGLLRKAGEFRPDRARVLPNITKNRCSRCSDES